MTRDVYNDINFCNTVPLRKTNSSFFQANEVENMRPHPGNDIISYIFIDMLLKEGDAQVVHYVLLPFTFTNWV